jgi:hypothetical protein
MVCVVVAVEMAEAMKLARRCRRKKSATTVKIEGLDLY